jgi:hypothetical protein
MLTPLLDYNVDIETYFDMSEVAREATARASLAYDQRELEAEREEQMPLAISIQKLWALIGR